jgi:hypothetical protein
MNYLEILRTTTHLALHLFMPGVIAWLFYREKWKFAWLLMICTMVVDLDHLLATPLYDPNRMSIGFHLLHSYGAIIIYFALFFIKRFRIISIGLLLHMLTDWQDYFWIN